MVFWITRYFVIFIVIISFFALFFCYVSFFVMWKKVAVYSVSMVVYFFDVVVVVVVLYYEENCDRHTSKNEILFNEYDVCVCLFFLFVGNMPTLLPSPSSSTFDIVIQMCACKWAMNWNKSTLNSKQLCLWQNERANVLAS